jgi:hypothetical protein
MLMDAKDPRWLAVKKWLNWEATTPEKRQDSCLMRELAVDCNIPPQ